MDLFFSESDISEQDISQIIQPPRQKYNISDLGPNVQMVNQTTVVRKDFEVTNIRSDTLKCSLYFPRHSQENKLLVIFLHGNSGSRLEANAIMPKIVPLGYHLCSFDSSASGLSGGNYVTMGINERDDLSAVIQKMKSLCGYQYFILWGRSMGAVTSLLYCLQYQQESRQLKINGVVGLIIDSAFYSFEQVCQEMVQKRVWSIFADRVAQVLRRALKKRLNGIDLFDINLYKVNNLSLPAVFAYSETDTVVGPNHGQSLYRQYGSSTKLFVRFKGEHNQKRGTDYFDQIVNFIENQFPINRYNSSNTQPQAPFHQFHQRSSSSGMIQSSKNQCVQSGYDRSNNNCGNDQTLYFGGMSVRPQFFDPATNQCKRSNSQELLVSNNQFNFSHNNFYQPPNNNFQLGQESHTQVFNYQNPMHYQNEYSQIQQNQPLFSSQEPTMFSSRINLAQQHPTYSRQ